MNQTVFVDTVRVREREVENLQSAYSEVRCVILRLQQHLRRLEVESQHIVTQDGRMSTETEDGMLHLVIWFSRLSLMFISFSSVAIRGSEART